MPTRIELILERNRRGGLKMRGLLGRKRGMRTEEDWERERKRRKKNIIYNI